MFKSKRDEQIRMGSMAALRLQFTTGKQVTFGAARESGATPRLAAMMASLAKGSTQDGDLDKSVDFGAQTQH